MIERVAQTFLSVVYSSFVLSEAVLVLVLDRLLDRRAIEYEYDHEYEYG